ncbi:MAG: AraC family transcriptional regulator ligand-binding domain-containing protein [Aquabacterium sp.]
MNPRPHATPTVPISYVLLMLDLAAAHGVPAERLLHGLRMPASLLADPDGRVSLRPDYAELCRRALQATGEPALAYEFGLRSTLTTHGIVGYGLMSQPSLRHVLDFAERFGSVLRLAAWDVHFTQADGVACMRALESVPRNDLALFSAQQLIISCCTILRQLMPDHHEHIVLRFDFPEPPYHGRYARRLPRCQFDAPFNEIRVPLRYLDQPIRTADTVSAKLAERACAQELSLMSKAPGEAIVRDVRALLVLSPQGYLSMAQIAAKLCVSPRTLTRQLSGHGSSYRMLLSEAQRRDSLTLLKDARLSIAQVASRLGYSALTNFARACRGWHGMSPSALRAGQQAQPRGAPHASSATTAAGQADGA